MERLEKSVIFKIIEDIINGKEIKEYEKNSNEFDYNFEFFKEDNFIDNIIFSIFEKKNKSTNETTHKFNQNLFNCLSNENINWKDLK